MSMSITDYLNSSTYQYSLTSAANKQKETETGKTQQSPVSASLDTVNMGEDGVAITQVDRQQETSAVQPRTSSPSTDTVEISAAGRAMSQQTASVSDYEYEAEDLSEYTDSELRQMYYRGDITLQEYEQETGATLE